MTAVLQILDNFLLEYSVGQVLLVAFVFSILGALPLKSKRVLALNVLLFGVIFLATPPSLAPLQYKLLGIVLILLGPLLYVTGSR